MPEPMGQPDFYTSARYARNMIESSLDMIIAVDRDRKIIEFNKAAEETFGYRRDEVLGQSIDLLYADPSVGTTINQTTAQQGRSIQEIWNRRKNGEIFPCLLSASVLCDVHGEIIGFMGISRDISERKRAEQALQHSAERLKVLHAIDQSILAAQSPEMIAQAALTPILQLIPSCRRVSVVFFDSDSEERQIVSVPGTSAGVGEDEKYFSIESFARAHILDALRQGHLQPFDCLSLDDSSAALSHLPAMDWRYFMIVPFASQGQLIGTLNLGLESPADWSSDDAQVTREIADELSLAIQNARLLRQVQVGRELLQTLSHRLAEAQESERHRIAQELHDQIGQNLTTLGINLNVVQSQLAEESIAAHWVQNSLELLADTIKRTRDLMAELRPPVLDDYGLAAALRWYGDQFQARTGVAVLAPSEDLNPRLPLPVETALFRIAQEALTNVAKHAQAHQVRLTLESSADRACLQITDDGVGFDTQAHHRRGARREWGFITMRERAEAVRGSLRIQSTPGQGTQLSVQVPR